MKAPRLAQIIRLPGEPQRFFCTAILAAGRPRVVRLAPGTVAPNEAGSKRRTLVLDELQVMDEMEVR